MSYFTKSEPVPKELIKLLGLGELSEMSRTEVTKKLYEYIKANKLQKDNRIIIANNALHEALKLKEGDELSFYNIQIYIKKLYLKEETADKSNVKRIMNTVDIK